MVTFLTSSFVTYQPKEEYVPKPLDETNDFGNNLRKYWLEDSNFLIFASDPCDEEMTDHTMREMKDAFSLAGFSINEIRCFDNRAIEAYCRENEAEVDNAARKALREAMQWADVFFFPVVMHQQRMLL